MSGPHPVRLPPPALRAALLLLAAALAILALAPAPVALAQEQPAQPVQDQQQQSPQAQPPQASPHVIPGPPSQAPDAPQAPAAPQAQPGPQAQLGPQDQAALPAPGLPTAPPALTEPVVTHVAVEAPHVDPSLESMAMAKAYRLGLTALLSRLSALARADTRLGPDVQAFTDPELKAALSALVMPEVRVDRRTGPDENYYRVTLWASLEPDRLAPRLAPLAAAPALRAALAQAYAAEQDRLRELDARDPPVDMGVEDWQVTQARLRLESTQPGAGPVLAPESYPMGQAIVRQTSFRGMSARQLVAAAGRPDEQLVSTAAGRYDCLRYGNVWAVFHEGALSCLRERLQYDVRHQSECSCFGEVSTFVPFPPQTRRAEP